MAKAEKELEGIHKVIEESGGKLSNRLLQCDVRLLRFLLDLRPPSPLLMANERLNRWIARLMDWWCSVCLSCSWSLRGGGLMAPQLWQSSTLQIQELGVISNMTIIKEHPTQSIRKHAKMVGPNIFQIYFDFCIIHSSSALQTQVSLTLQLASCVSSEVDYSVKIAALFCLFTSQNDDRPELSPPTDAGYCPVKLGMMSNRLQSGVNTLQGFREDKRNQITLGK